MFWNIFPKEVQLPEGEGPAGGEPAIELEWGWTAGMSAKDMENYADDAPTGKESVFTTLSGAKELRDRLDEIIVRHET